MSFLAKHKKADLSNLALELGLEVEASDRISDLIKKIKSVQDFDEEDLKSMINVIVEEREKKEAQLEKEKDRQFQLENLKLNNMNDSASLNSVQTETVKVKHELRKILPKYENESTDISLYLTLFERQAKRLEISETEWVTQLISLLPLDLVNTIIREPEDKVDDYDHIKEILLEKFKIKPETFRLKFVQCQRKPGTMWKEILFELNSYLDGWLTGINVSTYEDLKKLMICDQIKRRASPEQKNHFIDTWCQINDPAILVNKLDDYESVRNLPRKGYVNKNHERKDFEKSIEKSDKAKNETAETENKFWKNSAPQNNWRNTKEFEKRKKKSCYECGSTTHLKFQCDALKKSSAKEKINNINTEDSLEKIFAPHMSKAMVEGKEMDILRDTGASFDLVARNHVNLNKFTGKNIWLKQPLDEHFKSLPVVEIKIESPIFGEIFTEAAVMSEKLDSGLYILGNRTADLIEQKLKKTQHYVNAVVTRSKTRPKIDSESMDGEKDLSPAISSEEISEDSPLITETPLFTEDVTDILNVSSEELAKRQKECETLESFMKKVGEQNSPFIEKNGLFFRRTEDKLRNARFQLLVPKSLREKILYLTHETVSGHLGNTKTKDRILRYFFWPNCIKDIEDFVKSCDSCQKIGKANEKKKAPLKLVPVISEIFTRLNIDAVGPLPVSKNNKKYLLTAICLASKYPEAIPLTDISSFSIIDGLLAIFSRMGFPREIQCDLGTSFNSNLTINFLEKFGIKIINSSTGHPQSNPVERFHRVLKKVLKVTCLESGEDWEKNLPAALFALRTATHESTGFSPSELVHGRNLRTPEVLLYEHWVEPKEENSEVTAYIFELINRMKKIQDLAVEKMIENREKRKLWYDRNAVERKFEVGDKVLVLAISKPNKLAAQWIGPGTIEKRLSETNYIVQMPNRREKNQIYHVNMLKPYYQRKEAINLILEALPSDPEFENNLDINYPEKNQTSHDFYEITRESDLENKLNSEKIKQLKDLIERHINVFSNDPGLTNVLVHDIELIDDTPVRSRPYRNSQRQTEILREEIDRMLKLKIIEVGQSNYASPMILVETPGKDPRPCVDYRKLNAKIKTEFFPLPNIEERVEVVSGANYITVLDLSKGYWQVALTERAQNYAAFVTSFGSYKPLRMPFGLVNSGFCFSCLMSQILANCEKFAVPYLDDIAVFSDKWEHHLEHLEEILKRIHAAGLTIKPSKCKFAQSETKYLGHIVGNGVRSPAEAKIEAVKKFPTPKTKTDIRAFMGLVGYYGRYIKDYSIIAAPLTDCLKGKNKKEKIVWTEKCDEAFSKLKESLTNKPVLHSPNFENAFIVQTDASDVGIGVVLSQKNEIGEEHPILYLSKKFSPAEKRYSTVEKECLGIIFAIGKLKYYLDGHSFEIITDHNPLIWLKSNCGKNARLIRWALALQQFDYTITHKKGSLHSNADALSRI